MISARLVFAAASSLSMLSAAHATCYTVVDSAERVVYQSLQAPFDLSGSISQQIAKAYPPRHHLLIAANAYCPGHGQASSVYGAPLPGSRLEGNVSPALRLADSSNSWTATAAPASVPGWTGAVPAARPRTGR